MEGAVRSGYLAAQGVLARNGRQSRFLVDDLRLLDQILSAHEEDARLLTIEHHDAAARLILSSGK